MSAHVNRQNRKAGIQSPDPTRRRLLAGAVAATTLPWLGGLAPPATAGSAGTAGRVVVVGGGFGGATAARYLKIANPSLDVTLVEPKTMFHTCPHSNLYIGGLCNLSSLVQRYDHLRDRYGVKIVHAAAEDVDASAHKLELAGGRKLHYDRLVLAPGIDLRWNAIEGYDEAAAERMPHAWKAGGQAEQLRHRLESIADGDTFVVVAPELPFRCPPGPYERASLAAHYFAKHKPKSKVLILDAKDSFSKKTLFMQGWETLYGDRIEWVGKSAGGKVVRVDPVAGAVELADGSIVKAALINVIPPQKAGVICDRAGVTDASGWVPVKPQTFESRLVKDIHVVGDATIAGAMPKSGFSANAHAKVAAVAIAAELAGRTPPDAHFMNTCYSLVAPDYAISVCGLYRVHNDAIVEISDAGGFSPIDAGPEKHRKEAEHSQSWYAAITKDTWA